MKDTQNAREVADPVPIILGFIFYPGSKRYVGDNPDAALFHTSIPGDSESGCFC